MSLRRIIYALLLLALVTGCVRLKIFNTNGVKRGMTSDQLLRAFSPVPYDQFDFKLPSSPDTTYRVLQYDIDYGGTVADFYFVFKADKLMYWGFPYEFNRYPDPTYNEIGAAIVKRLNE